jgi:hypothetical protein
MPDEQVYDDGSEVEIEVDPEEPPDRWVDSEEILQNPTRGELEAGEFLGQAIDVDDDDDNGLQWQGWSRRMFEELNP